VETPRPGSDERLDELYREHPGEFVAKRNALVKELRANGDRDEAERLRRLRRPTGTAWLINRVALDSPGLLEEFAAASQAVERAQREALAGADEAPSEWRTAAAREREAIAAVGEAAKRAARDAGHPANSRALELVVETLRAAGPDPELRDRVLRGRVEREQSAATLGIPALTRSTRRTADPGKRRAVAQARRELKILEGELAESAAREETLRKDVEETSEALSRGKAKLAKAKRETTALRRRLKAIERRARVQDRARRGASSQ
jgi:chromosome segregation ATPase